MSLGDGRRDLFGVLLRGVRQWRRGRWRVEGRGRVSFLVCGLSVFGYGCDGALFRLGEFVIVDFDVLFELAIFVPFLDFGEVLIRLCCVSRVS